MESIPQQMRLAKGESVTVQTDNGGEISGQLTEDFDGCGAVNLLAGHELLIPAFRITSIRRQIASGTYETPEKLSVAIDRLIDDAGARDEAEARFEAMGRDFAPESDGAK